mgnify:CR=1 FL=1|tara:strand:- start:460 stop:888 length:429 start_codon:yes stop_codon:yes gene_type:complete
MTLQNTRATFEKAVTDAVLDDDPTISMVYDNLNFNTPGQEQKYVIMNMNYSQSTIQPQGAAIDYYSGVIQCNIHVPKNTGTKALIEIAEKVIDGLISVNASNYVDTLSVKPRVGDIVGPNLLDIEERSHFVGVISCQFSANA